MLSLPDTWNYSVSGLVALSKDGKDSVMSALSELEKFGYLVRVKLTNEKGQFNGVEYNIYEEPIADYAVTDKRDSAIEKTGKRDSEKQALLKTNKSNIKENKVIYDINNYMHILDTIGDSELRNLYVDFLENRNYMNSPLTVKGLELLRERVRDIVGLDIAKQKKLLKTAIINNWKNVYPKGEEPVENEDLDKLKGFYS